MTAGADKVVVGKVGRPYGVRGWVHVSSFTEPADNLLAYRPWQLGRDGVWQRVQVSEVRAHKQGFVASFEGIVNRNAAAALAGCDIGVDAAVLPAPAPGEYYWKDLIGLAVVDRDGVRVGRVVNLLSTPAHDVLVIERVCVRSEVDRRKADRREALIPFVAAYVVTVDLDGGEIVIDRDPDE